MNKLKFHFEKLIHLDLLIRMKATGTPKELARKLKMSERRIYDYIRFIKCVLNAPVSYNCARRSYEYLTQGNIYISFMESSLFTKHYRDPRAIFSGETHWMENHQMDPQEKLRQRARTPPFSMEQL